MSTLLKTPPQFHFNLTPARPFGLDLLIPATAREASRTAVIPTAAVHNTFDTRRHLGSRSTLRQFQAGAARASRDRHGRVSFGAESVRLLTAFRSRDSAATKLEWMEP